ncbi:hypothetical protein lerEdw1_002861 [Lerista edwardsae]|nr:hypothetical protein lerEdw1_002861 [Lerista edwardsae]
MQVIFTRMMVGSLQTLQILVKPTGLQSMQTPVKVLEGSSKVIFFWIVTIPEVQRCWSRFLMLQPDQKGNLPLTNLLQPNNPFGQKLLKQIPVTNDDRITFQTYCNAVSWLSKSSSEIKLKGYLEHSVSVLQIGYQMTGEEMLWVGGLYQTLSSGTINKNQLQDLLHNLYPMESLSAINALAVLFLKEVDKGNQGYISEEMFVAWVQAFPQEMVESILKFPIIPPNLILIEPPTSYMSTVVDEQDKQGLDDQQLLMVATEISTRKRDWKLLAHKLGISEKDCFHSEHQNLEMKNQILKMLQIWHRTCPEAPLPVLQTALRQSGNVDICNKVFHLSF